LQRNKTKHLVLMQPYGLGGRNPQVFSCQTAGKSPLRMMLRAAGLTVIRTSWASCNWIFGDAIFSEWRAEWERHLITAGWAAHAAPAIATTIVSAVEGAFILARASRSILPFTHVSGALTEMLNANLH
jgi:hypothetical protein